jgi:hypothetical protein
LEEEEVEVEEVEEEEPVVPRPKKTVKDSVVI